jgi:hypothetical protein
MTCVASDRRVVLVLAAVALTILIVALVASQGPVAVPGPHGVSGTWTLTFDDEFNGTKVDTTRWTTLNGLHLGHVTDYSANVSEGGGYLTLKLASSMSGAVIDSARFDGAGVNGYALPVGSFTEARIDFSGSGTRIFNWPAWWTSGQHWPASGENDIAEGLGTLTVNYHSPDGAHDHGTVPGVWSNAYHIYGLHRLANRCDVYYDGKLVKSYPTDDNGKPQALLINVGRGHTARYPSYVKVDYVRAWKP